MFVWLCLRKPRLCSRKHALNCHRMKPALFNVLCEIKEKTGKFTFPDTALLSSLQEILHVSLEPGETSPALHRIFFTNGTCSLSPQRHSSSSVWAALSWKGRFAVHAGESWCWIFSHNTCTIPAAVAVKGLWTVTWSSHLSVIMWKYERALFLSFFFMLLWNNGERWAKLSQARWLLTSSPRELPVKVWWTRLSLFCIVCLSINAVERERVSRIIARREIM